MALAQPGCAADGMDGGASPVPAVHVSAASNSGAKADGSTLRATLTGMRNVVDMPQSMARAMRAQTAAGPWVRITSAISLLSYRRMGQGVASMTVRPLARQSFNALVSALSIGLCRASSS